MPDIKEIHHTNASFRVSTVEWNTQTRHLMKRINHVDSLTSNSSSSKLHSHMKTHQHNIFVVFRSLHMYGELKTQRLEDAFG